jgi:3-hydroxyisobutyrate dehydrogenase
MGAVVAVLGAGGTMGAAMARNLLRAGLGVRAWNRTGARAGPLAGEGAEVAATPAEAARGAGLILTMLADGDAVVGAMEGPGGALAGAGEGAVWIQASTIGEAATERCGALADEAGVGFVDAPVLGTKQPAEAGELVVLASGPGDLRPRVAPVLDAIGRKTIWAGEAGEGTRLKLVTNSWVLAVVEATAETVALAEGLGVDPSLLYEAVEGGPLDMGYLRTKGAAMSQGDFAPSFRLSLAAKDARLVEASAVRRGLELPLVEAIRRRLEQAVPEHGHKDVSATYATSARRA